MTGESAEKESAATRALIREGLLMFKGKFLIPFQSPLRNKLLIKFHGIPSGGHRGALQTCMRLAETSFGLV